MKTKILWLLSVVLIVAAVFGLAACAEVSNDNMAPPETGGGSADDTSNDIVFENAGRLLVYNVSVNLTITDLAVSSASLKKTVNELGGWLESGRESTADWGAHASLIFRVPTEKLNGFLDTVDGTGKVTYKEVDSTDVTTSYTTIQARITSLEKEKATIEALLEDASNYNDILNLSSRLSLIDAELGKYDIQKKNYDSIIEYSIVKIYLSTPSANTTSSWQVFKDVLLLIFVIGGALAAALLLYLKNRKNKRDTVRKNREIFETNKSQSYGLGTSGQQDEHTKDHFESYRSSNPFVTTPERNHSEDADRE